MLDHIPAPTLENTRDMVGKDKRGQKRRGHRAVPTATVPPLMAASGDADPSGSDMSGSSPLGTDFLRTMTAEVTDWNTQITSRYAYLAEYVDTLEKLNTRLEGRVDRSLAIAEVNVIIISGIYVNDHLLEGSNSQSGCARLGHEDERKCGNYSAMATGLFGPNGSVSTKTRWRNC